MLEKEAAEHRNNVRAMIDNAERERQTELEYRKRQKEQEQNIDPEDLNWTPFPHLMERPAGVIE